MSSKSQTPKWIQIPRNLRQRQKKKHSDTAVPKLTMFMVSFFVAAFFFWLSQVPPYWTSQDLAQSKMTASTRARKKRLS